MEIKTTSPALVTTAKARAYSSATQAVSNSVFAKIQLNTESYDPGSNFDISELVSGTADGTTADHLIDSGTNFVTSGVVAGDRVKNTTDTTYAYVTVVANGDLTLDGDIFVDTETYEIKKARFVAPVTGYYLVTAAFRYQTFEDGKWAYIMIYKNGVVISYGVRSSGTTARLGAETSDIVSLTADDYLELWTYHDCAAAKALQEGSANTFIAVHLLSV